MLENSMTLPRCLFEYIEKEFESSFLSIQRFAKWFHIIRNGIKINDYYYYL